MRSLDRKKSIYVLFLTIVKMIRYLIEFFSKNNSKMKSIDAINFKLSEFQRKLKLNLFSGNKKI